MKRLIRIAKIAQFLIKEKVFTNYLSYFKSFGIFELMNNKGKKYERNFIKNSKEISKARKKKCGVKDISKKIGSYVERINLKAEKIELISQESLAGTEYYFENGLRKVRPYHYKYLSNAKSRWIGRTLVQVFAEEFYGMCPRLCKENIQNGSLTVNNKMIDSTYIIKNGDSISSMVHRHELPVRDQQIDIVEDNAEVLVVNKPASLPIHPCARYCHNTLLYILAKEHGYNNLRVVHRLDRLTSGLMILAKNEEKAKELTEAIKSRSVQKTYLSKVEGIFPKGGLVCEEAIRPLSRKMGVHVAHASGKPARTLFNLLSTDGATSIVKCEPVTGRTHQIRIHLQYLGYPIINDPLYNQEVWGPNKGENAIYGKTEEQLLEDLDKLHRRTLHVINSDGIDRNSNNNSDTHFDYFYDQNCIECNVKPREVKPEELLIYLHALSYQGPEWKYETATPCWARGA